MKPTSSILAAVIVIASAVGTAGCYVYTEPVPNEAVGETYAPTYYDGNVVYYDEGGAPYVYVGHEARYVPHGYAHYDVLVGHYRTHGRAYHAWYRTHRWHEREEHEHHRR